MEKFFAMAGECTHDFIVSMSVFSNNIISFNFRDDTKHFHGPHDNAVQLQRF